jgi:parallel beta-helix repeat protein
VVDGGALDLRSSVVTSIRDTPLGGTQTGHGVVVGSTAGQGGASNGTLHLEDSTISDFQKIGVIVRSGSTATILDNDIVGQGWQCVNASNGIQFQGSGTVAFNRVTANSYYWCGAGVATSFGIGVFSPSGAVDIHDNALTGNEIGMYFSAAAPVLSAVTVSNNSVVGLEDDVSGHVEADDSYGVVSVWAGPNLTVSENSFTRNHYGLYLAGGGETVTSNTIGTNVTGLQIDVNPVRLAGNAIVGNGTGAAGIGSGGPNWWGCNEGPTDLACDTATGYTEADWLVLSLTLPVCEVEFGASIPATLSLATTSSGVATVDAFVPPTAITPITGNHVSPTPASGMTTDGVLAITLTGTFAGTGTLQAQAENALVAAPGAGTGCPTQLLILLHTLSIAYTGVYPMGLLVVAVLLGLAGLLVRRLSY